MSLKNLNYSFFNKILFFLVFFTLPFQTSKFFFFPQSYILGIRKDLLAPSFYLKYIFILGLLAINFRKIRKLLEKGKKYLFFLLVFFLVNFSFSVNKPITVYKIFQILLLIGLCLVVYEFGKKDKKISDIVITALLFSSLLEFFLALYQFITGSSFQRIFYFLGERKLDLNSPSVAKTIFFDKTILRAYGTFSHPNSLAGFYLLVYFLTLKKFFKDVKILKLFALRLISSFLILLSFSKTAIFLFWVLNIYFFFKKDKCVFCKIAKTLSFTLISLLFLSSQFRVQSFLERKEQMVQAIYIFLKRPFLGVGLGAYLSELVNIFPNLTYPQVQPVHNLFLLLLVEGGVFLGFVVFYFLLKLSFLRKKLAKSSILLFIFIFTSFFDHYWWSLPQNLFSLCFIFF